MFRVLLVVLGFGLSAGLVVAEDPIQDKLDAAKASYESDLERLRKSVTSHLDDREKRARKEGNKQAVDQVKADREAFEQSGEWPSSAPTALTTQRTAAENRLEGSYKTAISEYVKAKLDDKAAGVELDRASFQRDRKPAVEKVAKAPTLEDRLVQTIWTAPGREYEFLRGGGLKINGKEVGRWAAMTNDRVVAYQEAGNYYDLFVFDKDFKILTAHYIGQPGVANPLTPMVKK